jgi:DNA-binding CsgD family transcriptional regulator
VHTSLPEQGDRSWLRGRDAECAALEAEIAKARDGAGLALVIRGGPGIGKTSLIDYAASVTRDCRWIRIAGLEAEAHIELAGLHRLLVPHLARRATLPGPQRAALEASLGLSDGPPASPFLLGLAVLTLLNDLARDHPVVCAVDDAQWLDTESARVLAFVARRLVAERIAMLFAVREPASPEIFADLPALPVGALGHDAAVDVLLEAAGGQLDRQIAATIAGRADGNPLALVEVGRELAAGRAAPALLVDGPLPVGQRLGQHFRDQIRHLPEASRQLLLLAAADLGREPAVLWRAAGLAGLRPAAAAPAEAARLIELSPQLRFRHPVIRSAAYDAASPERRRQAHRALAAAAAALGDRLSSAWQLAAATVAPNEHVAAELAESAEMFRLRGSLLNQSALLARAAELSPVPAHAAARRLRAAEAALLGGAPLRARSLLAQTAWPESGAVHAKADQLRVQALIATGRGGRDAPGLLLAAGLSCADDDPVLARDLLLQAVTATIVAGRHLNGTTPASIGGRILTLLGDPRPLTGSAVLLAGLATLISAPYPDAAPLLRRGLSELADVDIETAGVPVWVLAGSFAATAIWDDRTALAWLERCEDQARRAGAMRPLTLCLISLSIAYAARGQLRAAERLTAEGRELGRSLGWSEAQLRSFSAVRNLAYAGDRAGLRQVATTQRAAAQARGTGDMTRVALAATVVLHLGFGEYEQAFEAATLMRANDTAGLSGEALPALVEAGARTGRPEAARTALAELERCAQASGTDWALGLLARSAALLAPPDQAEPLYRTALGTLGRTTAAADHARAHLLYGEWLRRQGRLADARDALRQAHGMFTATGAAAFARRAAAELEAAGERAPGAQPAAAKGRADAGDAAALTPQESQIALLAASGFTNSEIAGRLFISVNTVEYHLKKVFRKLGLSSRRQLRTKLGSTPF